MASRIELRAHLGWVILFGIGLSACSSDGSDGGSAGGASATTSAGAGGAATSAGGGAGSTATSGAGGDQGTAGSAGSGGSGTGGTSGTSGTGGAIDDAGAIEAGTDATATDVGSIPEAAPPTDAGSSHALFVWGYGEHLPTPKSTDPPLALDVTMKARLESKGLTVDMVVDAESTVADAMGKALVVISSSINRDNLFDNKLPRFKDVAVPTIVMKDGTIEVMGLGAGAAGGFSTAVGMTLIAIVAPSDPLAAGLTGNVSVYTKGDRLIWAQPAPAAKKIATIVGHADEVAIFAYAAGATMANGTAPAKRMGFFIHRDTDYSPDGLKLFDAAVAYLLAP
jgi:hypothetical protein